MDDKKALWNSKQKVLKEILLKSDKFDEAIKLCLEQHAMVHLSKMSEINAVIFEDELRKGLDEATIRTSINEKKRTIAYGLWHSTRIEDITMNILVADGKQVINTDNWLGKMDVPICDTGNVMTDDKIMEFSQTINLKELRDYRIAVGRKTREIILKLSPADLKREIEPQRLQRVLDEGAVLNVESANWLIEFWGKKNVAGILLMPVTRHHIVHINESMSAKRKSKLF
jgi:hypothetical protein